LEGTAPRVVFGVKIFWRRKSICLLSAVLQVCYLVWNYSRGLSWNFCCR